ncbi:MAG: HEAT repeat domain-containing protein [Chloroflexi bacterium]|nr:HEAT repeat domain-containing protein [Chloroflexota bacterium]MBU1752086.1 HEAT repeat domain-containing protein [Chloroflexota bacterium]
MSDDIEALYHQFVTGSRVARRKAADALVQIGRPAVPYLERALRHERADVREKAAYVLGHIGDASALVSLTLALDDDKDVVRGAAAMALGQLGSDLVVPALVQALDRATAGTAHWWMGRALGHLGALAELVQALDSDRARVREAAVSGFSVLGAAGIPYLVQALGDRSKPVRKRAASILGQQGDQRAVPYLVQVVEDPHSDEWERAAAARLLEQLGHRQSQAGTQAALSFAPGERGEQA